MVRIALENKKQHNFFLNRGFIQLESAQNSLKYAIFNR